MIHYHGTPITPQEVAVQVLTGRHALISFAHHSQITAVTEVCSSFVLDNGAFSFWKSRRQVDWEGYYAFVADWVHHPRMDWALIPDDIDGGVDANDRLVEEWPFANMGVPVWHLHEPFSRLTDLAQRFPRVALGSSGEFAKLKTAPWWERMHKAFSLLCPAGEPIARIHGLRMLDPEIVKVFPFASGDSSNIALNIGLDKRWRGGYSPMTKAARAFQIAKRMENSQSPCGYCEFI